MQTVLLAEVRALGRVPFRQDPLDPGDEILGRLARGQADDAVWIICHPLQKPQGGKQTQRGEVLHGDIGDVGREELLFIF